MTSVNGKRNCMHEEATVHSVLPSPSHVSWQIWMSVMFTVSGKSMKLVT